MRHLARLAVSLAVVTLTAGPLFAAPVSLHAGASLGPVSAPSSSSTLGKVAAVIAGAGLAVGIAVKDTSSIAKKFVQRASQAAPDYTSGVQGSGGAWESATKNSEANYEQGVQAGIARKAFGKGVQGSGGKFETNAVKLGAQRYPQGVQNAEGAYAAGFQPYADTLKGINLPPRGARRSPANQQRANMVALELGKKKESM
jgi:hypothetical protein